MSVARRDKLDTTNLVTDVSFKVQPGEIVGVVGPSGSGKTLTGLAVSGLLPSGLEADGSVKIDGVQDNLLTTPSEQWRHLRGTSLSYIGQNALGCLHPAYRIKTQLGEAITVHQSLHKRIGSRSERSDHVDELLEAVDLPTSVGSLRAHNLSGGMRQRVAIAMAIANNPRIIIADEITTALDPTTEENILGLLSQIASSREIGLVLITHNIEALRKVAGEIVVFDNGEVVEAGPAQTLFDHPISGTWTKMVDTGRNRPGRSRLPESEPLLTVANLTKSYRNGPRRHQTTPVLEDISFTISEGETLGLVGTSGSGKTTIARIVCGLSTPTSGTIRLEKSTISPAKNVAPRRDIQLVFQDPFSSFNPRKRILDQVADPLIAQKIDRDIAQQRAEAILSEMGISEEKARRFPSELSGGQLQRAGIGRALIVQPKLVVLDEPVAALDLPIQQDILGLLIEQQLETKVSYLFISHDHKAVEQISHHVLELHDHQLRQKELGAHAIL